MKVLELTIPPLPQLLTVGRGIWLPGQQHFRRSFGVYDLIFVKSGALYMSENDIPYEIKASHLLVLEPHQTHWGHLPCAEPTEVYWLHFLHQPASRYLDSKSIPWSQWLRKGTDADVDPPAQSMYLPKYGQIPFAQLQPILDRMLAWSETFTLSAALPVQALLSELLSVLQASLHIQPVTRTQFICQQAIGYLQNNLTRPFSRERMEQELHFQFDYLTRCLKKHTDMTPLKYLHHLQIEKAKQLLVNANGSVGEIAEQIGLADTNYFIRLFRKMTGITPGEYRRARR